LAFLATFLIQYVFPKSVIGEKRDSENMAEGARGQGNPVAV